MNTVLLFLLAACSSKDDAGTEPVESEPADQTQDADGDGAPAAQDCDDADASRHPGAAEVCDEVDQDCDGSVDEGVTTTFWADADGDGYGGEAEPVQACAAPDGSVAQAGDCDDRDAEVHPGAEELCDDVDNDCDGEVDGVAWVSNDFADEAEGMQLNGEARVTDGRLVLTEATSNARGSAFYEALVDADEFTARFTIEIGGGSGADGMTFAMLTNGDPSSLGLDGVGLGVQGLPGWAVEFDTYDNDIRDQNNNHVAVVRTDDLNNQFWNTQVPQLHDGGPHQVEVHYDLRQITVTMDGEQLLSGKVQDMAPPFTVGFTAGTGRSNNRHVVDDVTVGCY